MNGRRTVRGIAAVLIVIGAAVGGPVPVWSGPGEVVLRAYMVGDARTLDPHLAADFPSAINAIIQHLRLVTMDGGGRVHPMGARSWTVTGGGLVYTFALDPRARFHDGRPVTADDWKWSFDRLADPQTGSGGAPSIIGGIVGFEAVRKGDTSSLAGVRVVNPTTLQIALEPNGRGGFLNRLSTYQAVVLNRAEIEAGGRTWHERTSAGAGPFRLTRWERNSRFVYAANAAYFLGRPRIDTLELAIVPSATTRLNLYDAGQIDFTDVPLADYRRVAADSRYAGQLKVFPRAQILYLGLNPAVYEAFKDLRVRRAVAHAIDRDSIARTVFGGFYTAARTVTPPQVPGTDASMAGTPFDPQAAKRLLAESGWAGKLPPLEMAMNPAAPDYQMIAEAVAAMLKEHLGIEVRLQRQEFAAFQAALSRRNVFASFIQGWSASFLDYSVYMDQLLDSRSPLNRTNYQNPEFDRLIDQANRAASESERQAFYRRAEAMALAEAGIIPVTFSRFAVLVKPHVRGFQGSPLYLGWTESDLVRVEVRR